VSSRRIVIFGWAHSVHVQRWAFGPAARGCDVRVVSLGGQPLDGIDTVTLPRCSRLSYFTSLPKAVAAARAFKPDLVHVHSAAGFGLWGWGAGLHPMVVSVWGSDVVDFPSNPWRRVYLRRVLHSADAVTATSRYLSDVTTKLCPQSENRLHIIPFGVEIPPSLVAPPEGRFALCAIKAHKPVYGLDHLIRALAKVIEAIPDTHLTIAGSGPSTLELKSLAQRLGLDPYISFPGELPPHEGVRLLQRSHLMVMPSLREAFGVAALEASAAGRAVVATQVGGVPEVVRDGETGLLVSPGDVGALAEAIIKLGRDRATLYRMGEAGRRFVQADYTWQNSLDTMLTLYEKLLNG